MRELNRLNEDGTINLDFARELKLSIEAGMPMPPAHMATPKMMRVENAEHVDKWICHAPIMVKAHWAECPDYVMYLKGVSGFVPIPDFCTHSDMIRFNTEQGHSMKSMPVASICGEVDLWEFFDEILALAPEWNVEEGHYDDASEEFYSFIKGKLLK